MNDFEKATRDRLIKESFGYIEKIEEILNRIDYELLKKAA